MERVYCKRCDAVVNKGKFCSHCGSAMMSAIQPLYADAPMLPAHVGAQPLSVAPAPANALVAQIQLEALTRQIPLMNQERMKAMVMTIAAQGGTGTVGFWSDC